jgi:restriction system protein
VGRANRGLYTPESAYYQPILQALIELGGSAYLDLVLERVEELMKNVLQEADYEVLPVNPCLRWNENARWARYRLVQKGLMKPKRKGNRGLWEISEAGREWLRRAKSKE